MKPWGAGGLIAEESSGLLELEPSEEGVGLENIVEQNEYHVPDVGCEIESKVGGSDACMDQAAVPDGGRIAGTVGPANGQRQTPPCRNPAWQQRRPQRYR